AKTGEVPPVSSGKERIERGLYFGDLRIGALSLTVTIERSREVDAQHQIIGVYGRLRLQIFNGRVLPPCWTHQRPCRHRGVECRLLLLREDVQDIERSLVLSFAQRAGRYNPSIQRMRTE